MFCTLGIEPLPYSKEPKDAVVTYEDYKRENKHEPPVVSTGSQEPLPLLDGSSIQLLFRNGPRDGAYQTFNAGIKILPSELTLAK